MSIDKVEVNGGMGSGSETRWKICIPDHVAHGPLPFCVIISKTDLSKEAKSK